MEKSIEQMQREIRARHARQHSEAVKQLEELELLSHVITVCVKNCNGEPGNGWEPDLKEALRLVCVMYWKTVRARLLLEDKATDGAEIEMALHERRNT